MARKFIDSPFINYRENRQKLFDAVAESVAKKYPASNSLYTLSVDNLHYTGPESYSLQDEKKAIMSRKSLTRPLKGKVSLTDNATGEVLQSKNTTLVNTPYLTDRGTYIHIGNEYSCLHGKSMITTDQGLLYIRDIVEKQLPVKVLSYDFKTDTFVFKRVIDWITHNRKPEELLVSQDFERLPGSIETRTPFSTLWTTPDHKIYNIDGTTSRADETTSVLARRERLSYSQRQLLYGSLLGDASICLQRKGGTLKFAHSSKQSDYVKLKHDIMQPIATDIQVGNVPERIINDHIVKPIKTNKFTCKVSHDISEAAKLCYPVVNGKRIKTVTEEWLAKVDAPGLAFWYMDDGSCRRIGARSDCPIIQLHTNGFDEYSIELLSNWLLERWGIKSFTARPKECKNGSGLIIHIHSRENVYKFLKLVAPYIPESMRYKLLKKPVLSKCSCGETISRNRKLCGACLKNTVSKAGISKSVRHHFKGHTSAEIRELLDNGIDIGNFDSMITEWEELQALAGSKIPEVIQDTHIEHVLIPIKSECYRSSSRKYASTHKVYDLTVEDTHNYFANGVLVSNCASQQRLTPGVFTRIKDSGELSAHVNVLEGGPSFHAFQDPESGKFFMQMGQAKIPLYDILHKAGVPDSAIKAYWGEELLNVNRTKGSDRAVNKLFAKLLPPTFSGTKPPLSELLSNLKLDPYTTEKTLGIPYGDAGPDLLLRATQKLIQIRAGQATTDDRDSLMFQEIWDPRRLFSERIERDVDGALRTTLWKLTRDRNLNKFKAGLHDGQLQQVFFKSGVAQPLEEINPLDSADQNMRLTRMGQGGIPSAEQIPLEARNVQPSQFLLVDPIRTPECYDEISQVFTSEGWKYWNTVDESTKLACLINSHLEFKNPHAVVKYYYEGDMYNAETGMISMNITPEHRVWACREGSFDRRLYYITGVYREGMTFVGYHRHQEMLPSEHDVYDLIKYTTETGKMPAEIRGADKGSKLQYLKAIVGQVPKKVYDWTPEFYNQIVNLYSDLGVPSRVRNGILDTAKGEIYLAPGSFKKVPYKGYVYCATVPGGLVYVKRKDGYPVWCGNSGNVGVDTRAGIRTVIKGGKLATPVLDRTTGRSVYMNAEDIMSNTVAFPGEFERAKREGRDVVVAMKDGKMHYMPPEEVNYESNLSHHMFTVGSALVPSYGAVKGGRLLMGAKSANSAMPIRDGEAPLTQSLYEGDTSVEEAVSKILGAKYTDQGGTVTKVTPHYINIQDVDGIDHRHDIYHNFPANRKSYTHNTPVVQVGDIVKGGQLIARSNYTDDKGTAALGRNLRIAYMAYPGNHEDGIVISESAAQKLATENMYTESIQPDRFIKVSRSGYISTFPNTYTNEQLKNIDDRGVIKEGSIVRPDDPLILATREKTSKGAGMVHQGAKSKIVDNSITWEHSTEGVVTDVWQDDDGASKVAVRTYVPMSEGSKMTGRYGDKGIVSTPIPDNQMPQDEHGRPIEIIFNPLGLPTRVNPQQIVEAVLGKIAAEKGKTYKLPAFPDDALEFAIGELEAAGMKDTETIYDPKLNRRIPDVLVGNRFFYVQPHTAESKESAREFGSYSAEGAPASAPDGENPKRVGWGELNALIAHGAVNVLRDLKEIKGQQNTEYWQALQMGYTPPVPEIPKQYKKFLSLLKAAGIDVQRKGDQMHLLAMTDAETERISSGEIQNPVTVQWLTNHGRGLHSEKGMDGVPGGLFDRGITGGHGGCFHPSVQILTDKGSIKIGDIVNNSMKLKVLSYNFETELFEYKPITGWFRNSAEKIGRARFHHNGLSSVFPTAYPKTLWGTREHQVYSRTGDKHNLCDAPSLLAATEVLPLSIKQVIIGSLLGDGYLSAEGHYAETHSPKQEEYLRWKGDIFNELNPVYSEGASKFNGSGKSFPFINLRVSRHIGLKRISDKWYSNGKKEVPEDIESLLDPQVVAVWYMDDGTFNDSKKRNHFNIRFCTQGFNKLSVDRLVDALQNRYGLDVSVHKNKKYIDKDMGWSIQISNKSARKLLKIIAPYIHPSMVYKLGPRPLTKTCSCGTEMKFGQTICNQCILNSAREARCYGGRLPDVARYRFGNTAIVDSILAGDTPKPEQDNGCGWWDELVSLCGNGLSNNTEPITLELEEIPFEYIENSGAKWEDTKVVYDIEVEGNHNYIANGILVSNSRWSHIKSYEPLPQPVMTDTVRSLLGLTRDKLESVYIGKDILEDYGSGPQAIQKALGAIDIDTEYKRNLEQFTDAKTLNSKNVAVRRLKALQGLKSSGIQPSQLMVSKIPVLPPMFRPITANEDFEIVSDINTLYKDFMIANDNLKKASKVLPEEELYDYRKNVYRAYGAVVGLMDPIRAQHQQRGVRGLLREVFGSGPKESLFQKKLLGTQSDLAARSVIVADHTLNMDQFGIPEDHAWKLYSPFIVRDLVKRAGGGSGSRKWALEQVENRSARARDVLDEEMKRRPILFNRAPALHKYSMMAGYPVIFPGKAFRINPHVMAGLNADIDGDAILNKVLAIVSDTVYNADINLQHKEIPMSAHFRTKIASIREDDHLIMVDLEDFPHEEGKRTKDHIDFYPVPDGVRVLAMDESTGQVVASEATVWTVHHDREVEIVTLGSGRQIITDDDPRAVYGLDIDTFTWCRRRPSESDRVMVPVVTNDTNDYGIVDHIDIEDTAEGRLKSRLDLSRDAGYALGTIVGDGWVSGDTVARQISLASSQNELHTRWSECMSTFFERDYLRTYLDPGMEGKFDNAKEVHRSTISCTPLAKLIGTLVGRGCDNKHLPPFSWAAPREFKLGLIAGLLDTDGSISVSASKAKPQFLLFYSSNSIRLVQEIQHLLRTLGVVSHIAKGKTPLGKDTWSLQISTPDFCSKLSDLELAVDNKKFLLETMLSSPPKSTGQAHRYRLMPMPKWLSEEICKLIGSKVRHYPTLKMAGNKGHISKVAANEIVQYLDDNKIICNHPSFSYWKTIVTQDYYHLERVKSIDKTGMKETGYDLTVPGHETFMSIDGIILSNTMAIHALVSEEAIEEAKNKMLASVNLRTPSDFDVHMTPRQEFLQGLYVASKQRGGNTYKFDTRKEAIDAFRRGDIDLKDEVVIKEQ